MTFLILFSIYYVISWMLHIYFYKELYKMDWEFSCFFATVFGFFIVWFIPFIMKKFFNDNKSFKINMNFNKCVIIVKNKKISSKSGIQFVEDYYSSNDEKYVYYNFPEENYCGVILINIKQSNVKEIDKIINKLNEWAEKEKVKNARIKAYEQYEKI